ncbi:MAG TPA: molybdopterin-dependent oxidoreductase [Acidobacteriota bacterium]|nr:molybdopterin-dependent oxidoreductase [Acidobacteriota bacterium]
MKERRALRAGGFGLLAGLAGIAATYLGHRWAALPYLPFDLFEWMARVLPGRLVNAAIDGMVMIIRGLHLGPTASTAKMAEKGMALIQFAAIGVVLGLVLAIAGKRKPGRLTLYGAIGGSVLFLSSAVLEAGRGFSGPGPGPLASLAWLAVVLVGGGALLGRALFAASAPPGPAAEDTISRRRFLRFVGTGSFVVMVTATGVSLLSPKGKRSAGRDQDEELARAAGTSGPAASPPPLELGKRFAPVPGTRSELTANEDFYRIDINLRPPKIDAASWRLKVEGLVERPLSLSLDDILARPRQTQALTLSCISNPVGGDLISTSFWTGTPLKLLLEEAGLKKEAREISIEAADGFYESVPLAEALDGRTLLVTQMNGEPLAAEHGFPLRIFIPGHYGMKQPKWIVRMEAIDHKGPGFWVDRQWSATAFVRTTSVIDVAAVSKAAADAADVQVGGIAYAGDKGISAVEVQVDGGPWQKAELRLPALSPLAWVQWRFLWKSTPGKHVFRVRAYDGTGALQIAEEHPTFPDGATGLHRKSI